MQITDEVLASARFCEGSLEQWMNNILHMRYDLMRMNEWVWLDCLSHVP